jgi:hypothetical protein
MIHWISIDEQIPEQGEEVLYCCLIDDGSGQAYFTDVRLGFYDGHKTKGDAIVMDSYESEDGDWYPCTHWMPLPQPPEISK